MLWFGLFCFDCCGIEFEFGKVITFIYLYLKLINYI